MIDQDFILLIMNCKKYKWKSEVQKNGWLKHLPDYLIYFHVLGDEELTEEYVFDEEERILWVRTLDDYVSLPKKVITAYKAIYERYNYKYIFKTDDDQELQRSNFFDVIKKLILLKSDEVHYGGHVIDVVKPYKSKYYLLHSDLPTDIIIQKTKYCSGRFYFLSCEAVGYLLKYRYGDISESCLEDYSVGFYLCDTFKKNILFINTNKYFIDF
jgi:hypothetical protein